MSPENTSSGAPADELEIDDLDGVAGGVNPQPLPPVHGGGPTED